MVTVAEFWALVRRTLPGTDGDTVSDGDGGGTGAGSGVGAGAGAGGGGAGASSLSPSSSSIMASIASSSSCSTRSSPDVSGRMIGTSSSLLASFDSATEPNSSARALTDATDAMRVSRVNSEFARQSLRALSQKDPEKVSVICMVASGARPAVDTLRASKLKI